MDEDTKKILLFILALALGLSAVFSGYFWKFHLLTGGFLENMFGTHYKGLATLCTILFFLGISSLMLITPFPAASCSLFLKIAYELVFGTYKESDVFTIGISFKIVIAILCVIAGIYSLYRQAKLKLAKSNFSEKDLARLI